MKKIIASLVAAVAVSLPALSNPLKDNQFNTMHSLGCMLLRECTDGVYKIKNISNIADEYPNTDYSIVTDEFDAMLFALEHVGVGVFLADSKYFPAGNRGVYHTVGNNIFLNKKYMDSTAYLMQVMRHEGWHSAQDCMAGTIENSLIAIIMPEEKVPMIWRILAERTYPKNVVPWEAEAGWAGRTEGMTANALAACATGKMWEIFEPTPLTREYLVKEGYINK